MIGRENLAAAGYLIPSLWDTALPTFAAVFAALGAASGLGLSQARTRSTCWTVSGACGTIGGVAVLLTGMGSALPAFELWFIPLGLAAGLVVGKSVRDPIANPGPVSPKANQTRSATPAVR